MIWGDGDGRRVTRVMNRMPLMNRHTGRTKAGTRTWRARLDDEQCAEHKKEKHDEHRDGKHDEPREETRDTSNDNARRTIRIARRMTRNGGAASAADRTGSGTDAARLMAVPGALFRLMHTDTSSGTGGTTGT
jgi:hypothetical protein